jgi:hypothetical protein
VAVASEPLLDINQAAAELGIKPGTLRQKLYDGVGPAAIKLPHSDRWRFRPSAIADYKSASEILPKTANAAASIPASKPSPARKRGRKFAPLTSKRRTMK